ncbi:MAG TPA: hypothetical protein VJM69_00065 [Dehalococcoidia bacterium]|nr:hypothetical protein [Dehalococcoidia bacterium]
MGKQRVGTAMHHLRQRLPFPLEAIHTDNGGELINHLLAPWWCVRWNTRRGEEKIGLAAINPAQLRRRIEQALRRLWTLADRHQAAPCSKIG